MRNIHFNRGDSPEGTEPAEPLITDHSAPGTPPQAAAVLADRPMRVRRVTVAPLEELALRAGTVRPISDSLAAMILSCHGRAEVTAKGIRIKREDLAREYPEFSTRNGGVLFWHPDSIVCSDVGSRERKWFYVINRRKPDCLHLLSESGEYVETLPAKEKPHVLDPHEQARVLAADRRAIQRVSRHLQQLHGEETHQALEDMRHNRELATRYVQTLDGTRGSGRAAESPQPLRTPTAEAMQNAERGVASRLGHRASAAELGRAVAADRGSHTPEPEPVEVEDWSDSPSTNPIGNHQPKIEQW